MKLRKVKLADGTIVRMPVGDSLPAGAQVVKASTPAQADDGIDAAVAGAVAKAVETLKNEVAAKQKATDNMGGVIASTARVGDEVVKGTGINAARYLKALAMAKMSGQSAVQVAQKWGYTGVQKALQSSVDAAGGYLVPDEYASEIIALLRTKTAIRKLGARSVPMGTDTLHINKQTGGGTAQYVGEGATFDPANQATGRVSLTAKKMSIQSVVSNDLIRDASVSAEEFVRDDLIQVVSLKEDATFLRATGSATSPAGILSLTAAANKFNATAAAPKAPTLAELKKEFAKAMGKLKKASIPMARCGWIFNARTEEYLMGIVDGNGNPAFEAELLKGTLRGYPVVVTEQVPENLGIGTNESEVYFGDFNEALIGESLALQLSADPGGTYEVAGVTRSARTRDETVITGFMKHDFALRHDLSFAVIQAVLWGAP